MDEINLGDEVSLKKTMAYDTVWTVMFIEGDKLYCSFHGDNEGDVYESIFVHKNLVEKIAQPKLNSK